MLARPESDEVLVKRLLPNSNNDPESRSVAWREWYHQVGEESVMRFIKTQNDTSEPDMDIFQEAMMTAFVEVERGRYRPHLNVPFAAYVKGIARNKIREARRRTRRFVSLEDRPQWEVVALGLQLEALIENQEQRETLQTSLAKLSQGRRQVLEAYLKGNSTAEIAQILGITPELVRQHKSRGLRNLRQMAVFAV